MTLAPHPHTRTHTHTRIECSRWINRALLPHLLLLPAPFTPSHKFQIIIHAHVYVHVYAYVYATGLWEQQAWLARAATNPLSPARTRAHGGNDPSMYFPSHANAQSRSPLSSPSPSASSLQPPPGNRVQLQRDHLHATPPKAKRASIIFDDSTAADLRRRSLAVFDIDDDPFAPKIVSPQKSDGYIDVRTASTYDTTIVEDAVVEAEADDDDGPGYLLASAGGPSRDSIRSSGSAAGVPDFDPDASSNGESYFVASATTEAAAGAGSTMPQQPEQASYLLATGTPVADEEEEGLDLDNLLLDNVGAGAKVTLRKGEPAAPEDTATAPTPPPTGAKPEIVRRQGTRTQFLGDASAAAAPPPVPAAKAKPGIVKRQGTATEFLPSRTEGAAQTHGDGGPDSPVWHHGSVRTTHP